MFQFILLDSILLKNCEINKPIVSCPLAIRFAVVIKHFDFKTIVYYFAVLNEKIHKNMKFDDWYVWVHMEKSAVTLPVFQSLDAYWPGLQVSNGILFDCIAGKSYGL